MNLLNSGFQLSKVVFLIVMDISGILSLSGIIGECVVKVVLFQLHLSNVLFHVHLTSQIN